MTNEENAIHNEWGLFEHHLRLLPLYDIHKDFDEEDYRMYDDLKQAIIVYVMKDKFYETQCCFLGNFRIDFYNAIEKIAKKHVDCATPLEYIKNFMEHHYSDITKDYCKMYLDGKIFDDNE